MKFSAKTVEQFADFGSKGIFRPSNELAPVILGLLPKDFDHVQFRTVGRQVAKEGIEFLHPAQSHALVERDTDAARQSPMPPSPRRAGDAQASLHADNPVATRRVVRAATPRIPPRRNRPTGNRHPLPKSSDRQVRPHRRQIFPGRGFF